EEEGEITASPMARMKPPTVPESPVPVLSDDELRRLLAACEGRGYEERRDAAIIRLFLDCGLRLAELAALKLDDVDFDYGVVHVVGKARRPRSAPFGSKAAQAIDRYIRARAKHPMAAQPWLWIGGKGRLTDSGVAQLLERRSLKAGLGRIHPHQLRHTFAHAWLAQGRQ
ncbi:MAG: tyrosine-type recombinase/integrase, partial [Acidimicrobiales bacterium]